MLAHRRIDANPWEAGDLRYRFRIEEPTHAMQSLEFEIGAVGRQFHERRDAVRIVSRELGQDDVGVAGQTPGTGNISDIRAGLAGRYTISARTPPLATPSLPAP